PGSKRRRKARPARSTPWSWIWARTASRTASSAAATTRTCTRGRLRAGASRSGNSFRRRRSRLRVRSAERCDSGDDHLVLDALDQFLAAVRPQSCGIRWLWVSERFEKRDERALVVG